MVKYQYQRLRQEGEIRILTLLAGFPDGDIHCSLIHYVLPKSIDGFPVVVSTSPATSPTVHTSDATMIYDAMSWTWGEEDESATIYIEKEGEPSSTHKVKPNLLAALKQLHSRSKSRRLWVDAICIDQADKREKDLQVAMMADIYGHAASVCVWLGECGDSSNEAINFINYKVSDVGAFEEITTDKQYFPQWKALAALMNRGWFSRRWVVQEIALARCASVHCGDMVANWVDFETAVALFERDARRITGMFREIKSAEFDGDFFGDVAAMGATRLVHAKSNLFRRNDDGTILDRRLSLSELVSLLSSFEAKEPHDMIYAVLALAKDLETRVRFEQSGMPYPQPGFSPPTSANSSTNDASGHANGQSNMNGTTPDRQKIERSTLTKWQQHRADQKPKVFQVDYQQPFFEVCKQFLEFTISSTEVHNLDILCRPWAPILLDDQPQLPSWVPSVEEAPFEKTTAPHAPGGFQMCRKNHDPLVGESVSSTSIYNACGHRTARTKGKINDPAFYDWEFGVTPEQNRSLFVTGFILDHIGEIELPSQEGNVPSEWFKLADWYPWDRAGKITIAKGSPPPERLWRTLVADRGPDGGNAKLYYPNAFEYAVKMSTPRVGIQTTKLSQRANPIMVEFLRRMTAVVCNRRMYRSARDGLLGLAPKNAKEGDCKYKLNKIPIPALVAHANSLGARYLYFARLQCTCYTPKEPEARLLHTRWGLIFALNYGREGTGGAKNAAFKRTEI